MLMGKVRFGISNLHIGTYSQDSLGAGSFIPGTVTLNLDPSSDLFKMHADNEVYWSGYSNAGYDGEIENALFTNEFKVNYLGYEELAYDGVAQVTGIRTDPVWIAFEAGGTDPRRIILYNVQLGAITREYDTEEDAAEPQTAKLPFSCYGDDDTTITMASFESGDDHFDDLFTDPPTPDDLAHYELQDEDGIDLETDDGEVILARIGLDDMIAIQDEERDEYNSNLLEG